MEIDKQSSLTTQNMTLLVQDLTKDDVFHSLEVENDVTIEDLKCLLEIESQIPVSDQALFFKNTELTQDNKKLTDCGISNNDMLSLTKMQGVQQRGGAPAGGNLSSGDQNLLGNFFNTLQQDVARIPKMNFNQMFSSIYHNQQNQQIKREVEQLKQIWANDPHQKTYIRNNNPVLADALDSGDNNELEKIIGERLKAHFEAKKKEQERMAKMMNADPNDPEAQALIAEQIKKDMIAKNYETAQEQFPEFFGSITMLYIDVEVNGTPIQSFVDSGAQSTIISKNCATRCGIMHLLDERFAGMAVGVGSSRILGRVHLADLVVAGITLQCSFTVLEDNKVDLLFGLDNLKRHQCCIDLVNSQLHIRNGEISVPFLGDGEIKKETMENEKQFGAFDDKLVTELVDMGYTKDSVLEALTVSGGDKNAAAGYLANLKD